MFKAIGNLLYKTPWSVLALAGLFAFLTLAMFTVPFNVIRLSDSGKSTTENRAIQREIDRTFGDSALTIAERVVRSLQERTTDPARKAEFSQALKEIADARAELLNAGTTSETDAAQAGTTSAAKAAQRAAKADARVVLRQARDAARRARDSAREKIGKLRDARKAAVDAQKRVGLNDESAFAAFDEAINAAKADEAAANETLKKIRDGVFDTGVGGGADAPPAAEGDSVPAKTKSKITIKSGGRDNPGQATELTIGKNASDGSINIDANVGGTSIKGDIVLGDAKKSVLQINGVDVSVPGPSLPPELRDEIRSKVSGDFRRLGIGSMLIVAFIPIFLLLIIAKIYIGRARRALDIAIVKTEEAASANVNRQIVEAKLMALQAQVEPHFLYNTLANVQALTEVDPQQANRMTGHLIQYLRASLPKMRENISTVGQEIELVRAYLNILQMRMGARLEFGISVPEDVAALPFPPLMLPSLVENAIKHGLEPLRDGGRIDVIAEKTGSGTDARLRIKVIDTGKGLGDATQQPGNGNGIGLTNIRERLHALFGDKATLTLESNVPTGVVAMIETPAEGAGAFAPSQAAASTTPATPKTWGAKTLSVAARTHSAWASILVKIFVGVISVLGVLFLVAIVGLATHTIPLGIGDTNLSGIEGAAVGTVVVLVVFGILLIVAMILTAVIYGLGFLAVGLIIGIPVVILASLFPVLAPFILIGFAIYWFWWRKKRKIIRVDAPSE